MSSNLGGKWTSVLTTIRCLLTFMIRRQVMGYPCWPLGLITKPCQPPHNCVLRTPKKLCEIFWHLIRVLLHDPLTNSPTISNCMHLGQHLLGASLASPSSCQGHCRLAKRLIRKCGIYFITCWKFSTIRFHTNWLWVRHIGAPWNLKSETWKKTRERRF